MSALDGNRLMETTAALRASAAQAPAAIEPVDSLRALCDTDAVVVSVAGEAAERAVFLGADGLVAHSPPGALPVGCGTVTVSLANEVHAAAAADREEVCSLLISHTPLPLDGPNSYDEHHKRPLDCCASDKLRQRLLQVSASRNPTIGNFDGLLDGRYHVYDRASSKLWLATDIKGSREIGRAHV